MNELRRRVITFALLGVISGALSVAGIVPFAPPNDFGLLAMFVLPGFAFGVIIGLALAYYGWLSPGRVLAWVVFATLGHFVAALCVTALTWRLQAALPLRELPAILIAAALGGGLGGGILAVANRMLVPSSHWIGPTMVGAILCPLVLLHDAGPVLGRLLFYMIWQGGYAATLAVALPASRRVERNSVADAASPPKAAVSGARAMSAVFGFQSEPQISISDMRHRQALGSFAARTPRNPRLGTRLNRISAPSLFQSRLRAVT